MAVRPAHAAGFYREHDDGDHLSEAQVLDKIATHEAGHVVAHLAAGAPVRDARIVRSGDGWYGVVRTLDDAEHADACVVTCLAGIAAETRWWQRVYRLSAADARASALATATADLKAVRGYLRHRNATINRRDAQRRADALVAQHWARIVRVAEVLRRRRRLGKATLVRLAGLPTPTPSGWGGARR